MHGVFLDYVKQSQVIDERRDHPNQLRQYCISPVTHQFNYKFLSRTPEQHDRKLAPAKKCTAIRVFQIPQAQPGTGLQ